MYIYIYIYIYTYDIYIGFFILRDRSGRASQHNRRQGRRCADGLWIPAPTLGIGVTVGCAPSPHGPNLCDSSWAKAGFIFTCASHKIGLHILDDLCHRVFAVGKTRRLGLSSSRSPRSLQAPTAEPRLREATHPICRQSCSPHTCRYTIIHYTIV